MSGINKVIIVGNLGADPEVRALDDGASIVTLSVATSDHWTDKRTGEKRQTTEWHRVVIFSQGLARIARDYLKKGARVYLEGQLKTRKWTDGSGIDRYTTEVVLQPYNSTLEMLGGGQGASDQQSGAAPQQDAPASANKSPVYANGSTGMDDLNEIPF